MPWTVGPDLTKQPISSQRGFSAGHLCGLQTQPEGAAPVVRWCVRVGLARAIPYLWNALR